MLLYCYVLLPISGIPEKDPRDFLLPDILNLGMSSTIATTIVDIDMSVMIPSLNLASLTRALVDGVWKPTTATTAIIPLGITRLNTENNKVKSKVATYQILKFRSLFGKQRFLENRIKSNDYITVVKTLTSNNKFNNDHLPEERGIQVIVEKSLSGDMTATLKRSIVNCNVLIPLN